MKKIIYILFIVSFFTYSCKESNTKNDNIIRNISGNISGNISNDISGNIINNISNSNPLKGLVLLGVEKTDSSYTVNNRCDGGYASLKMYEKEFYYYHPQEGATYSIQEIIKKKNNTYNIISNGYYYFEGDKLIPQKNSWILNKKNDLLWEFGKVNSQIKDILSDSLNIVNKKISYFIQPCTECFSEEDCEARGYKKTKVNSSISNKWLGKYSLILNENKQESRNAQIIELIINSDKSIFDLSSYIEEKKYELSVLEKKDTLFLKYEKLLNFESTYIETDNKIVKEKEFGYLIYDGKNYKWVSPYLDASYMHGKKNTYIVKKKV